MIERAASAALSRIVRKIMDNEKNNPNGDNIPLRNEQEITDLDETDISGMQPVAEQENSVENSAAENTDEKKESSDEKSSEAEKPWYTVPVEKEPRFDRKFIIRSMLLLASFIVFLGASVTTLYYIIYAGRAEFHADCTDTIMWANASVESGHLYDSEFTYACFLPFSTSTIMIPLIKIFGFGMTAHTIGMVGYFILLALFMVLMIREISGSTNAALCGTAVFLALSHSTRKMREIFWGHTIYYSLGILFLVIGAYMYARLLSLRSREKSRRREGANTGGIRVHRILVFLCLCVFIFLTGMDGITGITLFAIPFVGGVFAEQFLNTRYKLMSGKTTAVIFSAIIFMIMAVLGNLLNNELLGDLRSYYTEANSEFSDMNTWIEHIQKLPMAWMRLLGVENLADVMFTEDEGIINIINILVAAIAAVIPIVATVYYNKYGNDRMGRMIRIWVWMHWAVSAVILMGYICGILSVADWRIVPMVGTAIILSILFVTWAVVQKGSIARISVLLAVPVIVAGFINCIDVVQMPKDGYKENDQYLLAEFLEKQGMTMGYSTFWNANSITLITDGKVKVRDVTVDESGVFHRRYQSSNEWYRTHLNQREYFLLLRESESDTFLSSEKYQKEKPIRTEKTVINDITYFLYVYDHNFVDERNYAY